MLGNWSVFVCLCLVVQQHSDHTDYTLNISDTHSYRLQPSTAKAVTLKRAGSSLWGGIKPQPSVDTSHSGSFKITSVPMSIKQQMTVGDDHMWALSNKLSHSRDENKSEVSEEFWYYTSSNGRDKRGDKLLDKCHNEECCRRLVVPYSAGQYPLLTSACITLVGIWFVIGLWDLSLLSFQDRFSFISE